MPPLWQQLAPVDRLSLLLLGLMAAGTIVRLLATRNSSPTRRAGRLASLRTWWVLVLLTLGSIRLGAPGVTVLLAFASAIGMDEFLAISTPSLSLRSRRMWIGLIVGATYGTILWAPELDWRAAIPMLIVSSLVIPHLASDSPKAYLEHVGHALWGAMVLVWGIAHAAWLISRDLPAGDLDTRCGWFLCLIVLTEANDILQALVGRAIGRRRILPRISPNKTWEGLAGGLLLTPLTAGLLQWTLQLPTFHATEIHEAVPLSIAVGGGAIIALAGFVGDINMSCVKRDVGVKDGSTLLPGQGGMVDRIDSLSFTAPAWMLWMALWSH